MSWFWRLMLLATLDADAQFYILWDAHICVTNDFSGILLNFSYVQWRTSTSKIIFKGLARVISEWSLCCNLWSHDHGSPFLWLQSDWASQWLVTLPLECKCMVLYTCKQQVVHVWWSDASFDVSLVSYRRDIVAKTSHYWCFRFTEQSECCRIEVGVFYCFPVEKALKQIWYVCHVRSAGRGQKCKRG